MMLFLNAPLYVRLSCLTFQADQRSADVRLESLTYELVYELTYELVSGWKA
jgi:hypothetical protein